MNGLAALVLLTAAASAADFHLPFSGRWFVMQGGDTINVNHHMAVRAQWHGLDFMKVGGESGRELARVRQPAAPSDYFSWDETVLAPADGVVETVVDGLPDNPLGVKDPKNPAGNHVVIAVGDAWVFLGHLRQGSVLVKAGQRVRAGEPLGRCGNSGNSDAPHVHMHVQDGPVFNEGKGRSVEFEGMDVELSGRAFENVSWPLIRGLFVRPAGES